jgi:hypothetical protein
VTFLELDLLIIVLGLLIQSCPVRITPPAQPVIMIFFFQLRLPVVSR